MSDSPQLVFHAHTDPSAVEPFEIGHVQWARRPGEGGRDELCAGIWRITPEEAPEPFDLPIAQDESIYIVSGRIRIEVEGQESFELGAGSMASLTEGAKTRWTILEPTVEFFVYS